MPKMMHLHHCQTVKNSATRSKNDMVRAAVTTMVSRIFGGSIPALANSLLSLDDLSLEQIEEIKKLLDQKARELKRGDR